MLAAAFFDGRSSRRHEARLTLRDGELCVEGAFGGRREPLATLVVSEPLGGAPRTVRFADGAFCEVADHAGLAALLASAGLTDSPLHVAHRRWRWALGALAGVAATVAAVYVWVLPWLADIVAPRLPETVVEAISENALRVLDTQVLAPSRLPAAHQQAIAARLAALEARVGPLPRHRLQFRAAPRLGPNALALPDGELVLESRYSRSFEREADAYAGRLLLASGWSIEPLVRMLGRLDASRARRDGGDGGGEFAGLWQSHPDTAERIAA